MVLGIAVEPGVVGGLGGACLSKVLCDVVRFFCNVFVIVSLIKVLCLFRVVLSLLLCLCA